MSAQQNQDNPETLFSFELLVEFIRLDRRCEVSDELAVAVRLLDFPTLIIYQSQQSIKRFQQDDGEYTFNKGKCCFFKMNLRLLHIHLASTALYAMVLDVKQEMPILVGSSLISLAKAMDSIRQDASSPSSHTERELVSVCSLTGEKIGSISLSYKLLCMGVCLLPHITERGPPTNTHVHERLGPQELVEEGNKSTKSLLLDREAPTADKSGFCTNIQNNGGENVKILPNQNDGAVERFHLQPGSRSLTENAFEEEMNIFCPPHMYYTNFAEEEGRKQAVDYKLLNQYPDAFTIDESGSDDEVDIYEMHQKVQAEASELTPNVLADALQKLPVLNALVVELSQLNVHSTHHASPACIHRPGSTEPAAGHGNTPKQAIHEIKHGTTPELKHLRSPRNCSTPVNQSVKMRNKQEETVKQSKSSSKSPKKKLAFGTTKTFNLRLNRISPLKTKHRECEKMLQVESRPSVAKGRGKSSRKTVKSSKTKTCSSLNENIETVIQSVTVDSARQGSDTIREKSRQGKVQGKHDRDVPRMSDKSSLSELDLNCIHIPGVDSDNAPQSKDKQQHHSESDQSQPESDRNRERVVVSSRRSSTRSSFSNSSRNGNMEADYADDFNSLAPSDAFSPDPLSSPETSRAKTPKSPIHSDVCSPDLGSEGVQKRAVVLPVPVKARGSPQGALRATYVIRPRLHTSALSFSSSSSDDDDDSHRSGSSRTTNSRKQVMASRSGTETNTTPRGQSGKSAESRGPVRESSAESISSFEDQAEKELEDEVGSLDFRKEYQHISQLVAGKLPGYTM